MTQQNRRSLAVRIALFATLATTFAFVACTSTTPLPDRPPIPTPPARDLLVATAYPTLAEIYQGAQGIYRGCGPNGNVCHNSRQYPNMNTLGALALNVNQPCNQLQDDPTRIDDWCERQGDTVRVEGTDLLLAYIQRIAEQTETMGSRWAIVTQGDFPALTADSQLAIVRIRAGHSDDALIRFDASQLTPDPTRPNVMFAQVDPMDEDVERALARAGIPAERDAVQFGDPNRNGTFGVGLGNALILAGHPERSYIIRRLTDPTAGPLMPLANCCFWSKQSLRALWCWIANLRPDGSNAMDPIDYSVCPDGPVENVVYPEPGPTCENNGLCPVRTRDPIPDDPTWANVYANILVPRCGGDGCHRSAQPAGNLDLGTSDVAFEQLVHSNPARVVPGSAAMSLLYQRITQPCDPGSTTCRRMPLFQAALPDNEISIIQRWIANGARMDGMITVDAGPMDGAMSETGVDASSDIQPPTDIVTMDVQSMDAGMDAGTDVPPAVDVETDTGVDVVDDTQDATADTATE